MYWSHSKMWLDHQYSHHLSDVGNLLLQVEDAEVLVIEAMPSDVEVQESDVLVLSTDEGTISVIAVLLHCDEVVSPTEVIPSVVKAVLDVHCEEVVSISEVDVTIVKLVGTVSEVANSVVEAIHSDVDSEKEGTTSVIEPALVT